MGRGRRSGEGEEEWGGGGGVGRGRRSGEGEEEWGGGGGVGRGRTRIDQDDGVRRMCLHSFVVCTCTIIVFYF